MPLKQRQQVCLPPAVAHISVCMVRLPHSLWWLQCPLNHLNTWASQACWERTFPLCRSSEPKQWGSQSSYRMGKNPPVWERWQRWVASGTWNTCYLDCSPSRMVPELHDLNSSGCRQMVESTRNYLTLSVARVEIHWLKSMMLQTDILKWDLLSSPGGSSCDQHLPLMAMPDRESFVTIQWSFTDDFMRIWRPNFMRT